MDTRTGQIYALLAAALEAGGPKEHLVEVVRQPVVVPARSKYRPHQGARETSRRVRRQAILAASINNRKE